MFCTKCGSQLLGNAIFCINCGKANEKRVLEKKGITALSEIISKEAEEIKLRIEQKYEFLHIKIADAGNPDCDENRQIILRSIKFHTGEFEEKTTVKMKEYNHNGIIAFGIYANELHIGDVPKSQGLYLKENWDRIDSIVGIEVFGGNKMLHNQKRSKYGAEITVRLFKHASYSMMSPYVLD